MPKALVRKRCFVQMTGYEPVGPEHQHRRFIREMARFQKAWNVQGNVTPPNLSAGGAVASWTVETFGPNWRVTTDFHWFRWDDFVAAEMARSDWWRFPLGIAALMEFILTRTVVRYFLVAWRYGGFFLFPLFYLVGMTWLSIGLTRFAVGRLGLFYPLLTAPLLWLAIFIALRWTFGQFFHIGYVLDDWYFARDFVHRARPELEARLDRLAQELPKRLQAPADPESAAPSADLKIRRRRSASRFSPKVFWMVVAGLIVIGGVGLGVSKRLGSRSASAVLEIVEKYYPKERIPAKTQYFIQEACDEIFSKTKDIG